MTSVVILVGMTGVQRSYEASVELFYFQLGVLYLLGINLYLDPSPRVPFNMNY